MHRHSLTSPYITLMILLVVIVRCGGTPHGGSPAAQGPTHWSDERGNNVGPEPEKLRTPPPLGLHVLPSFPVGFERTLENGLKVAVLEHPTKLTTAVLLQIHSGRGTDADLPGLAWLSATLLDDGIRQAAPKNEPDFERSLEVRVDAVRVGLLSQNRDLAEFLGALKTSLLGRAPPLSRFDALRQELAQRAEDRLSQDDDWVSRTIAHRELFSMPGLAHPYARYADPATEVRKRTANECAAWRKRHVVPENADLVIVGPVQHEQAFLLVEEQLKSWSGEKPEPREPERARGPERLTIQLVDRPDNGHVLATLSTLSAPRKSAAWPAVALVSQALQGPEGQLGGVLSRKLEVLAQVEATHEVFASGPSVHHLRARSSVEDAGKVIKQLILQVSSLTQQPLSKPAVERGRGRAQAELVTELATPRSAVSWLSQALLAGTDATLEPVSLFGVLDSISVEQLFSATKPYFEPAHGALVVIGPKQAVARQLARLAPVQVRDPARGFSVVESHPHDPTPD